MWLFHKKEIEACLSCSTTDNTQVYNIESMKILLYTDIQTIYFDHVQLADISSWNVGKFYIEHYVINKGLY